MIWRADIFFEKREDYVCVENLRFGLALRSGSCRHFVHRRLIQLADEKPKNLVLIFDN
jgi:hypothetical protein